MAERLPTVCFFQAYNRDYIRSETLLAGLLDNGVPIVRCQVNRRGPLRYPLALARFVAAVRRSDVVLANFRSFELLPFLRLLTRKPIVYDAHISFWQSACEERGWFAPGSLPGRVLFWLDRKNGELADHVLLDTEAHREYFATTFALPRAKITTVYISCEDRLFYPRDAPGPHPLDGPRRVFWSGTGIPLQGLPVVYDAFRLLAERGVPVVLRLAGWSGILRRLAERAEAEGLSNLVFLGNLSRTRVADEIAAADLCLGGHYSTIPKARNVIAGKVYEMIASARPVIVGDSPAVRELFVDGESALLCEMGSAAALAGAVERLVRDPALAGRLAAGGYELYRTRLVPKVNVGPLLAVLAGMEKAGQR
jgi:glycosyltransferase involved in cell wall biosynthesis